MMVLSVVVGLVVKGIEIVETWRAMYFMHTKSSTTIMAAIHESGFMGHSINSNIVGGSASRRSASRNAKAGVICIDMGKPQIGK